MGKAVLLFALFVGVSSLPLAAAEPLCPSASGIVWSCADPEGGSVSYDNVIIPLPGGGQVPRTHADASSTRVNATLTNDGVRASLDGRADGARICAIAFSGSGVIQMGCLDSREPPQVPTDPDTYIAFAQGQANAILNDPLVRCVRSRVCTL